MNWHLILAFALAALLPIALIATGVELRRVRLRVVEDLRDTVFVGHSDLPQLVLALARYDRAKGKRPGRQDEVKYWAGALIYTLVCMLGFTLLLNPVAYLIGDAGLALNISNSLFWLPDPPAGASQADALRRSAAIAGVAFLGGYVFNMRYLIRQTLNQELSALAFVRSALRLIQGIILAMVAYHVGATAFPDPAAVTQTTGTASPGLAAGLAVAFVLGYLPDLGLGRIAQWARLQVKAVDQDALARTRIIPLEVIDGIDHEVAFRLQESNLFDVQNLAVTNPIELYAETPYTLLQAFDWVLQAQLCLVTGPKTFADLKQHRIRTIFDLERAILSEGVPDEYLRALACVILSDSSSCFRTTIGLPAKYEECPGGATASAVTIRHLVAIISDDLHVHRLRALWIVITSTTKGVSDSGKPLWLFNVGPLPGDPPPTIPTPAG
jgi:hypothetical protein